MFQYVDLISNSWPEIKVLKSKVLIQMCVHIWTCVFTEKGKMKFKKLERA